MPCQRSDLQVDAYLASPAGLFRVRSVRPTSTGVSEVTMTDESVPLNVARVPGTTHRRVVEPPAVAVPTHRVLREYDLLRHGPHVGDTASVEEWGEGG